MAEVVWPGARCEVGVARCDITPPVGIYHRMWGAATHDRATGVHQPLYAYALVLGPRVILVLDHCLLWGAVIDDLLVYLERATGLPRAAFAITFTHTHAAGLMDPQRTDLPGGDLIPPYLESLKEKLASLTRQAMDGKASAWITFAMGRCSLAAQRDFWDEKTKQIVCGFNPLGKADDTVQIARITGDDGKIRATVVNYACHPTTLAFQNTLISPDFPGAMRDLVEKATGGPCIFLQGASGDLGPREGYVGDVQVAERNGRQLGYAVLAALEGMPPPASRFAYQGPVVSGATLGIWANKPLSKAEVQEKSKALWKEITVDLPYRPELPRLEEIKKDLADWAEKEKAAQAAQDESSYQLAHAMVERLRRLNTRVSQLPPGKTFPLPAALGRVGDSLWVFVEGEHYQWLQSSLRERFSGRPLFVITLTNGWRCSYLPAAEAYGKGIYQETVAVLDRGCLESLADRLSSELERLI